MSTTSINATTGRSRTLPGRLRAVPWLTVVPLAVALAYADGFWLVSLRGAVGSIEATCSSEMILNSEGIPSSAMSVPIRMLVRVSIAISG